MAGTNLPVGPAPAGAVVAAAPVAPIHHAPVAAVRAAAPIHFLPGGHPLPPADTPEVHAAKVAHAHAHAEALARSG